MISFKQSVNLERPTQITPILQPLYFSLHKERCSAPQYLPRDLEYIIRWNHSEQQDLGRSTTCECTIWL